MNIGPAGNNHTNNNSNNTAASRLGLSWTPPAQNSGQKPANPFTSKVDPASLMREVQEATGGSSLLHMGMYLEKLRATGPMLEAMVQFAQQASSPQTKGFLEQQAGLNQRLNLTQKMIDQHA